MSGAGIPHRFVPAVKAQSKQGVLRSGRLAAQRPARDPFPQITPKGLTRHGSGSKGKTPRTNGNGSLPVVLQLQQRIPVRKASVPFRQPGAMLRVCQGRAARRI